MAWLVRERMTLTATRNGSQTFRSEEILVPQTDLFQYQILGSLAVPFENRQRISSHSAPQFLPHESTPVCKSVHLPVEHDGRS
eukprot:CAMPEP_0185824536 /NCGR_PEP_ID=MMETSP1322-20130828/29775_1 /TAXON_ID=265543 /ORGANISM="Minutocellus polymorphus, Strain RCC2270" /LENGTH=82 /DNA_ID=CAMNT_0028522185 /DNA_START=56 /DNA_END=301 /DNA_ORIENTATION=+